MTRRISIFVAGSILLAASTVQAQCPTLPFKTRRK